MILVVLGTFHIEFKRPLTELHKLCELGKINEEIVVQSGHTNFESEYFTIIPFIAPDKLDELYNRARVIITHAGTGSIIKGIKKGKKLIAIARLHEKGEHIDNHQIEILNEFSNQNYLLACNDIDSLYSKLNEIDQFIPSTYISSKQKIVNFLKEYIDNI